MRGLSVAGLVGGGDGQIGTKRGRRVGMKKLEVQAGLSNGETGCRTRLKAARSGGVQWAAADWQRQEELGSRKERVRGSGRGEGERRD